MTTNDEFISLSDSINSMVAGLQKAHQDSLRRINSELRLAYQIQTSQQPAVFPAFPDQNKIDLFALSRPAKEVSGDFYDFFCWTAIRPAWLLPSLTFREKEFPQLCLS